MSDSSTNALQHSKQDVDIIQSVPGGIHLLTIRNALKNQHASVMIGSGFSLNAQGGEKLPTWEPLVESLLDDLHSTEDAKRIAKKRLGGISGMLRLTQEYETLLGRPQLNAKLHELLPDAGVVTPGKLHTRLLSLLWTDVFTTNYDTLLERTLDSDRQQPHSSIKRRYQIVLSPEGIPHSKRNGQPRIVKLHGTLRSGSQLIVTEEDYRRYPVEFAPFVNTVQQSMLENVFCLIGFSGDDPNFLAWTGWARDHLGDKTANIYLITLSELSEGQRLILEKRKIFPIEIAELGKTKTGTDYKKALGAVLTYWEQEVPRSRLEWPYDSAQQVLQGPKTSVADLLRWLEVVRHNRASYPGWLVAPAQCRNRLYDWSGIIWIISALDQLGEKVPRWLRLLLAEEFRWIFDTSLNRLTKAPERIFRSFFESGGIENGNVVNPSSSNREEDSIVLIPSDISVELPSPALQKSIEANLLITLLRDAREDNDKQAMEKWERKLDELDSESLSIECRCALLQEKILYHLEHLEKKSAIPLLRDFNQLASRNSDHYWLVRAGALCGEFGWTTKGSELVEKGLLGIRRAIQLEGETTELTSRKLWAEWILTNFDTETKQPAAKPDNNLDNPLPSAEVRAAIDKMEQEDEKKERSEVEGENSGNQPREDKSIRGNIEHPRFLHAEIRREIDIAEEAIQYSLVDLDSQSLPSPVNPLTFRAEEAVSSARTYVRFIEQTALVPYVGRHQLTAQGLLASFKILALLDGATSSLRVFMRGCDGWSYKASEALLPSIIESLTVEAALELFNKMIAALSVVVRKTELDRDSEHEIRLYFDCSSRVAFRLGIEQVRQICDLAIEFHGHTSLRETPSLHDVFNRFFERAIRLLPETALFPYLPKLLSLSQSGGGDWRRRHSWPDAVMALPRNIKLAPSKEWDTVIENALNEFEGLSKDGVDEISSCVRRLDWLYDMGCMRPLQSKRFAERIWSDVAPQSVPSFNSFYAGAFVIWPTPSSAQNLQIVLNRYLKSSELVRIEKVTEVNGEMKPTWSRPSEDYLITLLLSTQRNSKIAWSESALVEAFRPVLKWWLDEGKRLVQKAIDKPDSKFEDFLLPRLLRISQVISQVLAVNLSLETIRKEGLDSWMQELWQAGISMNVPLVPLLFSGLRWWPEKTEEALNQAISFIASHTHKGVLVYSLIASVRWLRLHNASTEHTDRYILFLVDGILDFPEYLIEQKLNVLTELIENEQVALVQKFSHRICVNLFINLQQLNRPTNNKDARFNYFASPLLRVAHVKTLLALGRAMDEVKDDSYFQASLKLAEADSLLLIRKLLP